MSVFTEYIRDDFGEKSASKLNAKKNCKSAERDLRQLAVFDDRSGNGASYLKRTGQPPLLDIAVLWRLGENKIVRK